MRVVLPLLALTALLLAPAVSEATDGGSATVRRTRALPRMTLLKRDAGVAFPDAAEEESPPPSMPADDAGDLDAGVLDSDTSTTSGIGAAPEALVDAFQAKNWTLLAGLVLTVVVFFLRSTLIKQIPAAMVPWVTIGTAVLGAFAVGIPTHQSFFGMLSGGLLVGVVAIGGWETLGKLVKSLFEKKPAPPPPSAEGPVLPPGPASSPPPPPPKSMTALDILNLQANRVATGATPTEPAAVVDTEDLLPRKPDGG